MNTLNFQITNLSEAIENRKLFLCLHYIINGADINTQDSNNSTLLHELVDELYDGCYYNLDDDEQRILQDNQNFPILIENNKINIIKILEYLINTHHPILLQDISGNTPLHYAVRSVFDKLIFEDVENVIFFLTKNQRKESLNLINENHVSAWMLSILHNTPQSRVLAQINEIQINQSLTNRFGYDFSWGLTKEIFRKTEEFWGMLYSSQMIGEISPGWSDLMLLCLFKNYQTLNVLLSRKDCSLTNSDYVVSYAPAILREILPEENPLHYAVVNEDIELFKFLLKKLGPSYLLRVNNQGHTPLHKATHVKCHEILLLLLNFELLRDICEPEWELTEELYKKFVNFDSEQGMAANTYSKWMCTRKYITEEGYQLFINCPYYEIMTCGSDGDSLIHILAEEGYAQLLLYTSNTRRDIQLVYKNGSGHTPLQVAIESEENGTDKVIEVLAELARQYDINPNVITQYYINIRNCLETIVEETLSRACIEGLTIDRLLNIYLTGESFKSYGSLTAPST